MWMDFLISYGYLGMAVSAFLAGTFLPLSSEAVLGALAVVPGTRIWPLILAGTIGNVCGMLVNYGIGRLTDVEFLQRRLKVKPSRLAMVQRWCQRYGVWAAFFCFMPMFGTLISYVLGMTRTSPWQVIALAAAGMFTRFVVVAYSVTSLL